MPALPCVTLVIVPGLREPMEAHWQSWLAEQWPALHGPLGVVVSVPAQGRTHLDLATRVQALEDTVARTVGALVLVAHSGGCITVAHWARRSAAVGRVQMALLATPPDFDRPLPAGYPELDALRAAHWLPVPRERLPFASVVGLSRDDPLATVDAVHALARDWGSRVEDLGAVGHLNPAAGYGPWPAVLPLLTALVQRQSPR